MMISSPPDISNGLDPNVGIWDIDLFDTPASTISGIHDDGAKVICYFSAGTGEDWRPDYDDFQQGDLGSGLPDWQGEVYLNLRSANVLKVMTARIEKASNNG